MVKTKSKIELTSEQKIGEEKIKEFLSRKSDKKIFVVTGPAGTGKTTMTGHSLKREDVCYTATTHAATEVLRQIVGLKYYNASTIHSYLGLKLKADSDGKQVLKFNKKSAHVFPGDKIIIDEGSMINEELWDIIKELSEEMRLKIIIVGDPFQLPPINEEKSIALQESNIKLIEIMRQAKDNPIISLATKIRIGEEIDKKDDWNTETKTGIRFLSKDEALKEMKEDFNVDRTDKIRILAYTNKTVNYFNKIVRNIIFGEDVDLILENEFLISNTIHFREEGERQAATTSELLKVKRIEEDEWRGMKVLELLCKGNQLKTKNIRCVPPESKEEYIEEFKYFFSNAIKAKIGRAKEWQRFYKFKSMALPMFNFKNGRQTEHEGINYAYASTIHKAQGSTFDQIYLDTGDLKHCLYYESNSTQFYKRLLYTACTRPRLGLTIIK